MIITQPDRFLLLKQIETFAPSLTGDLLDVGSGKLRRYESFCTNVKSYRTMDHDAAGSPDIVGSAEKIPLTDESMDSILCTQVLEHLPHPHTALAEMFRVLRPGGRLLLTAPQTSELHERPYDYFRYTPWGLETLFKDAGFEVEKMDQRGKYHCMMAQMRIRQLVNVWKPYENRWAMVILSPLTAYMTRRALAKDRRDHREATAWHAIGWCVLAKKPVR